MHGWIQLYFLIGFTILLFLSFTHPDPELLVSKNKMITTQFLSANVTSLIYPMDEGVIQALKLRYRKKLIQKLLIEDDMGVNIVDFVKSIHMLQVSHLVAEAWEEILLGSHGRRFFQHLVGPRHK